jgi:uncharacterized protein (TIGR00369 family)
MMISAGQVTMPSFTPADPSYDARMRASFAQQGAMHLIGAEIVALAPGLCTVALPYRPELAQQDGFFHAGMVTTIIDTACGYAAFTLMPATARVLTVELKLNLMAPARGERLLATGRVERAGRTLTVVRGEVEAIEGDRSTAVALMQGTMMCLLAAG